MAARSNGTSTGRCCGRIALEPRLAERARSYQRARTTARGLEPNVRVLENEASDGATVVEVVGPDSVGLLYGLTRALADLDLDILRAKIATWATTWSTRSTSA